MSRSTPSPVAPPSKSQAERGPVVLLDSDPAFRRVVRLVLEGAGFRCLAAETVEDARSLVSAHHPALVLADLRGSPTPEEDLDRIRDAEGWRPRIGLMSAYPRRRRGVEDYFIKKPIEFDRLLQLLEAVEPGDASRSSIA